MTTGQLIAALEELPTDQPVDWTLPQLQEHIPALFALQASATALSMAAIAAFDAKGGGRRAGFRSTADWLGKTTGMSHPGAMVATARALRDELPATSAALHNGTISEEHVRLIRRAHRMLGKDYARIETHIATVAQHVSVRDMRGFIDRIIQQYHPERTDKDTELAKDKRKAFLSQSLDGWWHLNGLLDPETGERLRAALDIYADSTGPQDLRSAPMRCADALAEIGDKAVADINRTSGHGTVLIRVTVDELHSRLGVEWPSGALMSRCDVDKMTCSAEVATVIGVNTTTGWQPVNLGFTHRFATAAQRLALVARDGPTCIHPGCTVKASRCIAHHIVHWKDGGPSDLSNYGLACGCHHDDLHSGKLVVIVRPDGSYTTAPNPALE